MTNMREEAIERHGIDVVDTPQYRLGHRAYWNGIDILTVKEAGNTAHERWLIEQGWLDARDNENLLN